MRANHQENIDKEYSEDNKLENEMLKQNFVSLHSLFSKVEVIPKIQYDLFNKDYNKLPYEEFVSDLAEAGSSSKKNNF